MKKNLIMCIVALLFAADIYGQNLTPEERQYWVSVLDSAYSWNKFEAFDKIYADSIYEAVPKIEEIFWSRQPSDKCEFLRMLRYFNAPSAQSFSQQLLDTLKMNPSPYAGSDKFQLELCITEVMFDRGDYSNAEFVFAVTDSLKGKGAVPIDLLADICMHVPQYSDRAKNYLIDIAETKEYNYGKNYSFGALWYLNNIFGAGEKDIYKNILLSHSYLILYIET